MGYMNSYKRLDNLCRDCGYTNGVSGYIEEMERTYGGTYSVPGWQDDYKNLKHYRWIRNQIAHDNDADEENMCSKEDVQWIENFHQRILDQDDPLAQYHKIHTTAKRQSTTALVQQPYQGFGSRPNWTRTAGCAVYILMAIAITVSIFFFIGIILWAEIT